LAIRIGIVKCHDFVADFLISPASIVCCIAQIDPKERANRFCTQHENYAAPHKKEAFLSPGRGEVSPARLPGVFAAAPCNGADGHKFGAGRRAITARRCAGQPLVAQRKWTIRRKGRRIRGLGREPGQKGRLERLTTRVSSRLSHALVNGYALRILPGLAGRVQGPEFLGDA